MMLTIGSIAKCYGVLPSFVLANATTFDIMILDVMNAWEKYKNDPQNQENYDINQLEDIVKQYHGQ